MKKSEKKDYVFNKLSELLKPQGYYLVNNGSDPRFVLKKNEHVIVLFFNFKDMGQISFSKNLMSLKIIEDIMLEIQKPNQDYSFLDNEKYFLISLEDKLTAMPEDYYIGIGYDIENYEQLEIFTNWIIKYIETDGKKFIDKYSYLPNILETMDSLENEGLTWNNKEKGILSGSLDAYFRGLIISKFCNDPNFEKKINMMNIKFNQNGYEEWIPYYEKLKEKLKNLKPLYNI